MPQFIALLNVIFDTIAPIFIIIGLTMVVGRYKPLNVQTLSRISIYLFSPALILSNLVGTEMKMAELSNIIFATILLCTVMVILGSLIAKLMRFEREVASSFILAVFIMNSVNFGLPFIEFAFGTTALEPAVVFTVGQALSAYLFGTYVASRGKSSTKTAVFNVLTIPMPYAFALALWLNASGTPLPTPIFKAVKVLGAGIVPAALVILGLQLSSAKLNGRWKPIITATFTRFFMGAAVAYGITFLFGLQGLTRQVFIMQASMPAGILSGVLSTEFGGDPEYASAVILVTTLFSALFLSGLLLVVGNL
jgi:predicted permease